MAFEGIIPAVTTPFTADDQVDVAALKENIEKLIEAGVHGFVATGTMGEAGSLTARGARAGRPLGGRGRRRPRAGHGRRLLAARPRQSLEYAADAQGRGRAVRHVAAAARLPRRPGRGRRLLRRARHVRAAGHGLQQPRGLRRRHARATLIARIYEEVDARHRHQGVLGRHAPHPRAAAPRRRPRGASSAATTGRSRASPPARSAGSPASACSPRARPSSSTRPSRPTTWRGRATCTVGCSPSPAST